MASPVVSTASSRVLPVSSSAPSVAFAASYAASSMASPAFSRDFSTESASLLFLQDVKSNLK